jgi:hypothetical protein
VAMITLKAYAERHGRNLRARQQKAHRGGLNTAVKLGRDWLIDEDAPCVDERVTSGDYIGARRARSKTSRSSRETLERIAVVLETSPGKLMFGE